MDEDIPFFHVEQVQNPFAGSGGFAMKALRERAFAGMLAGDLLVQPDRVHCRVPEDCQARILHLLRDFGCSWIAGCHLNTSTQVEVFRSSDLFPSGYHYCRLDLQDEDRRRLRKIGLPDKFFEPDFWGKERAARKLELEMLEAWKRAIQIRGRPRR